VRDDGIFMEVTTTQGKCNVVIPLPSNLVLHVPPKPNGVLFCIIVLSQRIRIGEIKLKNHDQSHSIWYLPGGSINIMDWHDYGMDSFIKHVTFPSLSTGKLNTTFQRD
jgi:hypothetical protein